MPKKAAVKPVKFRASSLDVLREFPEAVRRDAGHQLDRVQNGLEPDDYRSMPAVGAGVNEIRTKDASGIYRVFYVAKFEDAIHVLHCFQKKTEKTAQSDIDLGKKRYAELVKEQKDDR